MPIAPPQPAVASGPAERVPLVVRRERLLQRSAQLRGDVDGQLQRLQTPLAVADGVRDGARWLMHHRDWLLGGLAVLAVLRPRRAWRWTARAWWAWRSWRRVGRVLAVWGPTLASVVAAARSGQQR